MRRIVIAIVLALLCPLACLASDKPKNPSITKALVIAGQDGSHWSEGAADCMEQILENTGLFEVDVIITPDSAEKMDSFEPDFSSYSLVIINYGGVEWKQSVKTRFENYVSNGGGVVVLHSSIIPMENWKAYNEMTGLGAWNGRNEDWGPYLYLKNGRYVYDYTPGWAGHHGLQHKTVIETQDPSHPIMKGLPPVWMHFKDEIYTKLRGPAKNIRVLATTHEEDRDEPMMWTVDYGKGRVFVDVLGHCGNDPEMTYSMTCAGFQITFIRGCEWAATGKVTYDEVSDFPGEDYCTFRMDFMYKSH